MLGAVPRPSFQALSNFRPSPRAAVALGGPNCPVCCWTSQNPHVPKWHLRPGLSIRTNPSFRVTIDWKLFCHKPHLNHCPLCLGKAFHLLSCPMPGYKNASFDIWLAWYDILALPVTCPHWTSVSSPVKYEKQYLSLEIVSRARYTIIQ